MEEEILVTTTIIEHADGENTIEIAIGDSAAEFDLLALSEFIQNLQDLRDLLKAESQGLQ